VEAELIGDDWGLQTARTGSPCLRGVIKIGRTAILGILTSAELRGPPPHQCCSRRALGAWKHRGCNRCGAGSELARARAGRPVAGGLSSLGPNQVESLYGGSYVRVSTGRRGKPAGTFSAHGGKPPAKSPHATATDSRNPERCCQLVPV
jgi:hypothetical protein